jgi:hypothetical protein
MNQLKYFALFSLLVCGCAAPLTVVNNPRYKEEASLKNRTLNVLFLPSDSIIVKNIDDVKDDFPNDTIRPPSIVIHDSLYQTIREEYENQLIYLQCHFVQVPIDSFKSQNDKEQFDVLTKSIINKDTVTLDFVVPKKQRLVDVGIQPDIGLIINKILVGRNLGNRYNFGSAPTYMPGNTISTPGGSFTTPGSWVGGGGGLGNSIGGSTGGSLDAYFQFILWDYKNDCEIAYGKISIINEFLFGMTKSTWKDEFRLIAKEISVKTPLKTLRTKSNVSW